MTIRALPKSSRGLTAMGDPLAREPPPATAVYSSPVVTSTTTPTAGALSIQSATETLIQGKPWTKLVVPSRGSTNHTRPSSGRRPPRSSPTTGSRGRRLAITARMAASERWSTSVTGSASALNRISTRRSIPDATSAAPARAASRATCRSASGNVQRRRGRSAAFRRAPFSSRMPILVPMVAGLAANRSPRLITRNR